MRLPGWIVLDKQGRPLRGYGGRITIFPDRVSAQAFSVAATRDAGDLGPLAVTPARLLTKGN